MKQSLFVAALLLFISSCSLAQTVGVISAEPGLAPGYCLYARGTRTLLINTCGELVYEWSHSTQPGLAVYLLEDGNLLRTQSIVSPVFSGGGSGGGVELVSPSGEVLWQADFTSTQWHPHHDIEPLPNGNFLMILWEYVGAEEAIALGRMPGLLLDNALWPTLVWEVEMVGTSDYNVVWEWHMKDHFIQDADPSLPNFGDPAEFPQKLNINLGGTDDDMLHVNGIDYHADRDEVVLSSRDLSELYVIDHAITSEEATGAAGDILYRWGNPINYGVEGEQQLSLQHQVEWVPEGSPGAGNLTVFNNGNAFGFSSMVEIVPPLDDEGNYVMPPMVAAGPEAPTWSWSNTANPSQFYSHFISGMHRLHNGNSIACEGDNGRFWEVTPEGELVWQYVNPVLNAGGVLEQGQVPGNGPGTDNQVFRVRKLPEDYPGILALELNPDPEPLEINPLPAPENCIPLGVDAYLSPTGKVYPNPVEAGGEVRWKNDAVVWRLMDGLGREIRTGLGTSCVAPEQSGWYVLVVEQVGHMEVHRLLVH